MKRIMKIKEGTKLYDLTIYLLTKGSVYKKDLLLYANALCSNKNDASRLIKELANRNYIYFDSTVIDKRLSKNFTYHKNMRGKIERAITVPTVFLTDFAISQLGRLLNSPMDYYTDLAKQFHSKQYDKVSKLYLQNHIKTLFNTVGVYTDELTRPNLAMVYCRLNNLPYSPNDLYITPQSLFDEVDDYLSTGIYFSAHEVRYFASKYLKVEEAISSVFRGVFISTDKLVVIYSNGKNNYSMIHVPYETSERVLISFFDKYNLLARYNVEDVTTGPYALTISDTEFFIYSTASTQRFGRATKYNKGEKKNILNPKHRLFNSNDQDSFHGLFSVTASLKDISKLDYLLHTSAKQHIINSRRLHFEDYPIRTNKDNVRFPISAKYEDKWYYAIYLPIYEQTTLIKIKEENITPIIITSTDMVNTIQHITHKQHIFIDTEGNLINDAQAFIYDNNGYVKGKKMLEDYLKSIGKAMSDKTYRELPKIYDMTPEEFYNSLARADDGVTPKDIADSVSSELIDYVPHTYSRKKTTLGVDKDIKQAIREYASKNNISMTTAMRRIMSKVDLSEDVPEEQSVQQEEE